MKNILKNILTGVAAALIIVIIFIFLMTHISQSTYTENVVREYIESYSSDISPAEINVIIKNLSNKIDNAINDEKQLSKEELKSLIYSMRDELSEYAYDLSQPEINKIVSDTLEQIIKKKEKDDNEKISDYLAVINDLTYRISVLENKETLTEGDVTEIVKNITLTEDEIINFLETKYSTDALIKKLSEKLNISIDELYEMIAKNRTYTDEMYDKLAASLNLNSDDIKSLFSMADSIEAALNGLSGKTGNSLTEIYKIIADSEELNDDEINKLAKEMHKADGELTNAINETNITLLDAQNQLLGIINDNKVLSDAELADLSEQLGISVTELKVLIEALRTDFTNNYEELKRVSATKEALEEARSNILAGMDAEEADRKAAIEQAVEELNNAIAMSSSDDAEKLKEAKNELEEALNNGLADTTRAMENAKELLEYNILLAEDKINTLNTLITEMENEIRNNKADADSKFASTNQTIEANKAETDASIASTNHTVAVNKAETDASIANTNQTVATNKTETDASIANTNQTVAANKAETDASIANTNQTVAANKAETDASIANTNQTVATNKAETDASIANANRTIEANKAETDASIANTNQTIAANKMKAEQDISNLQAIKAEIYYSNEDVPTLTIENVGTK